MLKKDKSESFKCLACGCTEYDIKNYGAIYRDEDTGKVIGRIPFYMAVCKDCGQPSHMRYIDKENRRVESEFERNNAEMLSLDQIKSLPRRYNVSRADFLKVMHISNVHDVDGNNNWEEFDIWDGDLPSNDEEERLEKVYKNPKAWIEVRKANKDLVSKEVYERSVERAESLPERNL